MASIGGITCDFMKGSILPKTERAFVVELPGADSLAMQLLGKGEGVFRLQIATYGSVAVVDSWATSIFALRHTIVTIVDALGITRANRLVESIGELTITAADIPGTSTTVRGEISVSGRET